MAARYAALVISGCREEKPRCAMRTGEPVTSMGGTVTTVSRRYNAAGTRQQTADQHHQPPDRNCGHRRAEPARWNESDLLVDPGPEVGPSRYGAGINQLIRGESASPGDDRC